MVRSACSLEKTLGASSTGASTKVGEYVRYPRFNLLEPVFPDVTIANGVLEALSDLAIDFPANG